MEAPDLAKILVQFAAADLRAARKHGATMIGGTKRGLVALRYAGGAYTLTTQGAAPTVIAAGKPGVVRAALAAIYVVEVPGFAPFSLP